MLLAFISDFNINVNIKSYYQTFIRIFFNYLLCDCRYTFKSIANLKIHFSELKIIQLLIKKIKYQ
jgi:ABC-type long-subunit fatty acid transport system fused permease/ATPase subunit